MLTYSFLINGCKYKEEVLGIEGKLLWIYFLDLTLESEAIPYIIISKTL